MELKFREVGEEYKNADDKLKGLKVKNFLTIEELNSIVENLLSTENQVERHSMLICKLAEYCTNIDVVDENNILNGNEVYNLLAKNDLVVFLDSEVKNNYTYDIIDKSENAYAVGKLLTEKIMDGMKGFDMNKIQASFSDLKTAMELNK